MRNTSHVCVCGKPWLVRRPCGAHANLAVTMPKNNNTTLGPTEHEFKTNKAKILDGLADPGPDKSKVRTIRLHREASYRAASYREAPYRAALRCAGSTVRCALCTFPRAIVSTTLICIAGARS